MLLTALGCDWSAGEAVIYGNYGDVTRGSLKYGARHGQWNLYFDGTLRTAEQWKNGRRHGLSISWYDSGALLLDTRYQNGLFHGRMRVFNSDGTLTELGWLRHGRRHGTWCEWYDNGRIKRVAEYSRDRLRWSETPATRPCPSTQGDGAQHRDPSYRVYER
ncbi:MAG: hypothetical protein AAGC55_28240 [Myxococcota bacterium]